MEPASHTLQRIMDEALKRLPPSELPGAAWEFAAGHAVAEKTRVLGLTGKTLLIEVPDANWRAQLQAMLPQLLGRIHRSTPIERIEFKLARPQDETKKYG